MYYSNTYSSVQYSTHTPTTGRVGGCATSLDTYGFQQPIKRSHLVSIFQPISWYNNRRCACSVTWLARLLSTCTKTTSHFAVTTTQQYYIPQRNTPCPRRKSPAACKSNHLATKDRRIWPFLSLSKSPHSTDTKNKIIPPRTSITENLGRKARLPTTRGVQNHSIILF